MTSQPGIWLAAWTILQRNRTAVLVYVAIMMLLGFAQEHMGGSSSLIVAQTVTAAWLAIPAHLSVLRNMDVSLSLKGTGAENAVIPFVMRGIGLGLLASVLPFFLLFLMLVRSWDTAQTFLIFGLVAVLTFSVVFAVWGTMLPAAVVNGDKRFARAARRASHSFGYAFPRLLVSFGVLSAVMVGAVMFLGRFMQPQGTFFPAGGVDVVAIFAALLNNVIGAYQIAMTAVILSRAYLMAEEKTAAQPVTA